MKDGGILHNAEPLVPEAMQIETFETGEKIVKCRWCPCIFSNVQDFNSHMKVFGITEQKHKENWKYKKRIPMSSENSDSF